MENQQGLVPDAEKREEGEVYEAKVIATLTGMEDALNGIKASLEELTRSMRAKKSESGDLSKVQEPAPDVTRSKRS